MRDLSEFSRSNQDDIGRQASVKQIPTTKTRRHGVKWREVTPERGVVDYMDAVTNAVGE